MKKRGFASAALWALAGNGVQYGVTFGLLVYLAHVLSPRDFGLMATVTIGLDLGQRIARWGQVELLQQQRYANEAARNQSFRLSMLIGIVWMLAFLAAARPVAHFYDSAELATLIYIAAPIFPVTAATAIPEAILRSQFRYNIVAIRNSVGTLIGAAVAIGMTLMHYKAEALAMQKLVQTLFSAVWIWSTVGWRPSFARGLPRAPGLAGEGTNVMLGTLMPLLVPRSVDLLVSFAMGPAMLGIMRVAFRINDFVAQLVVIPLTAVTHSKFSTQAGDLPAMQRTYLRMTQLTVLMMCPALFGLSLVAPEAIPFIFGHQWEDAVGFVQIIGLLGLFAPINYFFATSMMALGQSRLIFRQAVAQVVVGVTLAAISAQISLYAVAGAHVLRALYVAGHNAHDLKVHMQLAYRRLLGAMLPAYAGAAAMAAAILLARSALGPGLHDLAMLAILVPLGGVAYAGTVAAGAIIGWWPTVLDNLPKRLTRFGRRATA